MRCPNRPLRIGIVTDGLEERVTAGAVHIANGGVGVYIYNLVKELRAIDQATEYVLIRHGTGRLDIYDRGRQCAVPVRSTLAAKVLRALEYAYRRLADELQLDLLHFPNQFGGTFLPRRIKRVVTLHDLTPLLLPHCHPWERRMAYRLFMRRALRRADHVLVDSASTGADLMRLGIVAASNITTVPLGVAEHFRFATPSADLRQRYDLPDRFILSVGVLEPRKNHALLFEALRRLHAAGEQTGLVLVGRDGWRWQDPLANPAVAPLRPWVRIFRDVPDTDLVEFYRHAEVFAFPSLYEGFGLPVVEAMACGTPVVAARAASLPEVVGEAGLLAAPTDAGELAARLLEVLRNRTVRERLVAAGRQRAQQLSWRRTAEHTRAIYEQVCRT
ncbi:MAG: glycosyltransferase family 4 protein [Deltaproteobacteria bacterium]|nr:glycosyltransferase family 4 protein [Deltaproteobacteria bacterium]